MSGKAGRGSDQFMVRLPDGMRDRIKAAADASNRSMNAEIVATLEEKYPAPRIDLSDFAEIYRFIGDIYSAPTEMEQDLRIVEANRHLEQSGAPIVLRFSSERDVRGVRQLYMAKAKGK